MDVNLTQKRRGLEEKFPGIRKTLPMVEYLNERRMSEFVYFISDFPYLLVVRSSYSVRYPMLSYKILEATELLTIKLENAQGLHDDLEFLRERITVMEERLRRVEPGQLVSDQMNGIRNFPATGVPGFISSSFPPSSYLAVDGRTKIPSDALVKEVAPSQTAGIKRS